MASLRSHNAKKGGKKGGGKDSGIGKKKKGGAASYKLLKLDVDSADEAGNEDGDDGEELNDKAQKAFVLLSASLRECDVCGTAAFCKLTTTGMHKQLTVHQVKSWATVRETMAYLALNPTSQPL